MICKDLIKYNNEEFKNNRLFEINKTKIPRHLFTIPIKLFTKINMNNAYINGKYNCPFVGLSWFITILCTVAYIVSWLIDQLFGIILLLFVANKLYVKIKNPPIDKYKPIFVNDKLIFPNKFPFKENKSLTSNWSNGLNTKILYLIQCQNSLWIRG